MLLSQFQFLNLHFTGFSKYIYVLVCAFPGPFIRHHHSFSCQMLHILGDRNAIFMLRLFDGDDGKRLKALAIQFYITANYNLNKKHIVKLVFVNVWFFMSFALKENIELSFLKSWLFWIGLHLIVQVIKWRLFFFFFSWSHSQFSNTVKWPVCVFCYRLCFLWELFK